MSRHAVRQRIGACEAEGTRIEDDVGDRRPRRPTHSRRCVEHEGHELQEPAVVCQPLTRDARGTHGRREQSRSRGPSCAAPALARAALSQQGFKQCVIRQNGLETGVVRESDELLRAAATLPPMLRLPAAEVRRVRAAPIARAVHRARHTVRAIGFVASGERRAQRIATTSLGLAASASVTARAAAHPSGICGGVLGARAPLGHVDDSSGGSRTARRITLARAQAGASWARSFLAALDP